jgi:phosphoenolpyruvate synthase/pyruvate phosphate dikinase
MPYRKVATMTTQPVVLELREIDQTQVAAVGGKGASLGELSRIEGVRVPPGFVVTTDAYRRIVAAAPAIDDPLDRLARLAPDDRPAIAAHSAEVRRILEAVAIPDDVAAAITGALARLGGDDVACAVRSSATAEDLPTTSFAGQQDSYLNVAGAAAILDHVRRCWASLFTDRAVTYRLRNGFDHRKVHMAVVVQQMIPADAAGVLFTADPITGHRKVTSIEAVVGLGEALVSGVVSPDTYQVRDGAVVARTQRHAQPVLTDAQIVRLAQLGRRIEAHHGRPQDIEWCLVGDELAVVQSRPITTLFPIPAAADADNHVYLSVGHQQMMTDAMKPLGLSLFRLVAAGPYPMLDAGGRLFVDVTRALAAPATRAGLLAMIGRSDPLIGDALQTILDRGDFIPPAPAAAPALPPLPGTTPATIPTDPAIVTELIARAQASIAVCAREIRTRTGAELIDFILADLPELKRILIDAQSSQAIMAGMQATWWLNDHLQAWLGEKNAADALAQSVPHNVTSEMGLALLDVADVIRPYPDVVAFLRRVGDDDGFLDELPAVAGGRQAADAIRGFLATYGMRCAGEIDITRPRWRERPTTLVPIILTNVQTFEPGAGARRFEHGLQQARQKEAELLERLRALPDDGAAKADETKRMIDRIRTFNGYREYPKYALISRYFVYKQALLQEAERLVGAGVLREPDDIFYLDFPELAGVARTGRADAGLIRRRRDDFRAYQALTPPRVMTSDGEAVAGAYRRDDVPAGALVGLAVSAGTVEGRARVVLDIAAADLEPGDILVTAFTDPSWTPLFVAIKGLVTEVGGLMTHGAVIAREYGVPAVVGVVQATTRIRDGQRIRVHGTEGYVEIL